jgi:hypothetical protein
VDDIRPLRVLNADILSEDVTFLSARPVQQRMPASGGWAEGDASFVGDDPSAGAIISYYQRSRHFFGPITLQILDPKGKELDVLTPTKRPGINRVAWSMRVRPPRAPRAAAVAYAASQGPRVPPGVYTVRLTRGTHVVEAPLEIGIDRRAPYGVAERKEEFSAAMKVHALFGEMSAVVDRLEAARSAATSRAGAIGPQDDFSKKLQAFADRLEELRKKIVATTEGGAITGEERIREHADILYRALLTWEGRPTAYQLERIEVLHRELDEVKSALDGALAGELPALNGELLQRKLEPIPTAAPAPAGMTGAEAALLGACLDARWEGCSAAEDAEFPAEMR